MIRSFVVSLVLSVFLSACGGSSSSPTTPTPPAPTPPVPVLTFTPDRDPPTTSGLGIAVASRGAEVGKISLAIVAHNLNRVVKVRGTVRWNGSLLKMEGWGRGEWFEQGGANCDWTYYTSSPGELVLSLDRPSTLPGAAGSGEIFLLRLQPQTGVTSGSTALQWDEPALYDAGYARITPSVIYGGTVTIR